MWPRSFRRARSPRARGTRAASARAQAALGDDRAVARRKQRLQLRETYATLNELVDKPRYQLSLT